MLDAGGLRDRSQSRLDQSASPSPSYRQSEINKVAPSHGDDRETGPELTAEEKELSKFFDALNEVLPITLSESCLVYEFSAPIVWVCSSLNFLMSFHLFLLVITYTLSPPLPRLYFLV